MNKAIGIPGVGGSLGKCCFCGNTFMKEILCGETVCTGELGEYRVAFHAACEKKYVVNGVLDRSKLPDASPFAVPAERSEVKP